MKKTNQLIFSCLLVASVTIMSCTTTCPDPEPATVNITNTDWTMEYNNGSSGNNVYYAARTFIKNGVVTYPASLPRVGNYFTIFALPVPPEINLNLDTDSVKMVTNVKNPTGDGNAFEIDLGLSNDAMGAFASFQKGVSAAFCFLGAGDQKATNVTEHLIDPTNFAELTLSIQNNTVNSFRNGTLLKTFTYTGNTTAGGRLKLLTVSFRGNGTVDWIKLYKGSKLIMSEDFSTDGKTTAVWTMP